MHRLRDALQSDAEQIERVIRRSALKAYKHIFPPEAPMPSVAEALAEWEAILDPSAENLRLQLTKVAENDDTVVGVVLVKVNKENPQTAHMSYLYVDPSFWNQRVGSSLYAAAVDYMINARCGKATLWTLEKNFKARNWYERLGWRLTGERIAVYKPANVYDLVYSFNFKNARGSISLSLRCNQ